MRHDVGANIGGLLVAINLLDMRGYGHPWKSAQPLSSSLKRLLTGIPRKPETAKRDGAGGIAGKNAAACEQRLEFALNECSVIRLIEHTARATREKDSLGRSEDLDELLGVGDLAIARVKEGEVARASRFQMFPQPINRLRLSSRSGELCRQFIGGGRDDNNERVRATASEINRSTNASAVLILKPPPPRITLPTVGHQGCWAFPTGIVIKTASTVATLVKNAG